jgi:hypothetical protein
MPNMDGECFVTIIVPSSNNCISMVLFSSVWVGGTIVGTVTPRYYRCFHRHHPFPLRMTKKRMSYLPILHRCC